MAWGGEQTRAKGLIFHTHRKGELQVVTWSVHNLTYALVSGVDVPSAQSCAVCHESAKERELIQGLRSAKGEPEAATVLRRFVSDLNKHDDLPASRGNNLHAHVFSTMCDEKHHRQNI